jgi:hypothetical protein
MHCTSGPVFETRMTTLASKTLGVLPDMSMLADGYSIHIPVASAVRRSKIEAIESACE